MRSTQSEQLEIQNNEINGGMAGPSDLKEWARNFGGKASTMVIDEIHRYLGKDCRASPNRLVLSHGFVVTSGIHWCN